MAVLKRTFAVMVAVAGLMIGAPGAGALQTTVTQVEKGADGSLTYHFAVRTDEGETLMPGTKEVSADFFTVYNFYGLVEGSTKSPEGWEYVSETFGRTPTWNGYPVVMPVDLPNTPNLTWAVTKAVPPNTLVEGFMAITKVGTAIEGQYTAQVTRPLPIVKGLTETALDAKQATIGTLPTPSFLAVTK